MKNIKKSFRVIYLGAIVCSAAFLQGVYALHTQTSQHFILNLAAAFLALTITLVGFNLSAQHRNRFTPYVSISFVSAGTFDLLTAIFSNGILIRPTGSIQTFISVSQLFGQTLLSVMLAVGITLAVKRSGIWKAAPVYMASAMVLSSVVMLFLSYIPFQHEITPSTFGFYQLASLMPCVGYTYVIVYTFNFDSSVPSQREKAIGRALIPCLFVLCLAQTLFAFSSVWDTDALFLGYSLKVLAYLLALIALLHTLWRYAEYSFQVDETKVSTIFCIMLFVLSFLALLEFDRHKREVLQDNGHTLLGFLEYHHALNKIELGLQKSPLPPNESIVDELISLRPLQEKLADLLRSSNMTIELSTLLNRFIHLQTIVNNFLNASSPQTTVDLSSVKRELLPVIQEVRKELFNIFDRHHNELSETEYRKIAVINRQLVSELSLLFLLIIGVVVINRWHNRRLLQPLIHLNDIAKCIINNQQTIEESEAISRRKDELGSLVKRIIQMFKYLQTTVKDLEKNVEQQTRQLKDSEEQLRKILNNVEEGIITANQQGNIESVNPAACTIFGYSAQQMVGSPIYMLMREEERDAHIQTISQYKDPTNRKPVGTHRRRAIGLRRDGSTVPVKISLTEIVKDHHRTFVAVLHDITEEVQAENALKESEKRMSRFFSASIEGLLFLDHGKIIDSNLAAARLLGRITKELIGKNINEFFSRDNGAHLQHALENQDSNSWETEIMQHDGTRLPVNILIRDIEFMGRTLSIAVIRDITERKRAESKLIETRDELRQSLNLLKNIIESAPIRVFWKDNKLRYLGCNTLFADDIGLETPEELIGKTDAELPWKERAARYQKEEQNLLDHGKSLLSYEELLITPEGNTTWLRTTKVPLTNDKEQRIGILGVADDITQQKQTNQALTISETRLKEAQQLAHLGSWELDLVNNVLWWSDENYRIFGLDIGASNTYETFLNIVHPDDRKYVNEAYTDSVNKKTPYNIEHRLLMPDGAVKWVHERCMTYYDNDIPLRSIGTTMDITERKQTQHALDRYNQFTNSILDTINSLVFVVDIEGRIVRFNRACEKLTGYSFENINGKIIWSILPRSYDQECLRKCYQTPHLDNFPNKIRMDWPTAKGIIRTIDWENSAVVGEDGNIDYIIAAGIDITDRLLVEKMLEDQLRNLEQKVNERTRELDTMFALSPDGFVMINNQHNVIFTNPAFLEMTGLHFKDVIDISIDVFIKRMLALCDVSADSQSVDLVYFSDNPILYLQRPIQRVMSCIQRDIQDPGGRCIGKVLYFRDITHESEVDRIKSEFLSTAAHEFRTPLSSILGFSELLLSREFDKESSKKYIEIINRQSNHLKHLLDELLDLARIDARADRDFIMSDNTLEEVIQLVIEDSQAFATEKHELKTDFVDAWPLVSFDSDKIQQALFNILSNAYKYSPQGGTITCSTLLKHVGKKQMFGIRIEDQGIGMTPDELNHIGERFYRADTTGTIPGTGLGVSLVKEIIELHKGELEITSTLGQGAQFTVWLPVDPKNIQSVKRSV